MTGATAELQFSRRPSTLAYMLRALHPSPGLRRLRQFPPLRAQWRGQRIDPKHRTTFVALTGLHAGHPALHLLYPHVIGFPLQMVILTHPDFPISIWSVLQIRNHLLQHRPFVEDSVLDWDTRVAGQRLLDKGAEVDLHTSVCAGGELLWESVNTFYFRGRVGGQDATSPLARPPELGDTAVSSWHMPSGVGWRFAGLTGDYNGIHYWDWYAKLLGFPRAFHHPQVVVGQSLARLPALDTLPQRLDVWLKGPVYYGSDVHLRATLGQRSATFALRANDDERPAIAAHWSAGTGVPPLLRR